ncbi:MAG: helix-turn-helix transcriptional regulator [Bacteroidia bacterium]|nr:helix-turn-helix transcriptional regulator [Bacteroidia bacterium]
MKEEKFAPKLGLKIKKVRELKGYSQEYISTQLGITQNSYSKIERGETKLNVNKLMDICKILEIDINTLLNFDEKMIFNNCTQSGNFGENNTFVFNTIDKIQELYEKIIQSKDEEIARLNSMLKNKK